MKNIFALFLSISILSCGEKKYDTLQENDLNINGQVLNKWRCKKSLAGGIVFLYKNNIGKLVLKFRYKNGKEENNEVNEIKFDGLTRYQDSNEPAEYYLLESNGNLGMYTSNKKFDEAIKE